MVGLKINHCKWSRLQTVTVMPIYGEMSDKWWVPWGNPWCNVTKYTHVRILCYLCSQFLPHNNMRWLNQYLRERCNDVTMGSAKSAKISPVISPLGNGWCKVVSAALPHISTPGRWLLFELEDHCSRLVICFNQGGFITLRRICQRCFLFEAPRNNIIYYHCLVDVKNLDPARITTT